MKFEKRQINIILVLALILILVCFVKPIISAQVEVSSPNFDAKSIATWNSDFTKFEAMKTDDINGVWEKADSQTKLKFLNSYATENDPSLKDLKFDGMDNKNLKFFKSGTKLSYGDGSSSVDLKELPSSLDKLSYSKTTAQEMKIDPKSTIKEGENKFVLNFHDGSKISMAQGEISKFDMKNPGSFVAYNKLHFKNNNGQEANLFTNGQYSDIEINKDGKITFFGNSAVQTGKSDDSRSTLSKPIGPTQDAAVQMIDANHIQISKTKTDTWRGTITTSFSPAITDVIFGNQQTDSKQLVQLTNNGLSMVGKDISFDLTDKIPSGKELQKLIADGRNLHANIYGVTMDFEDEKTIMQPINNPTFRGSPGNYLWAIEERKQMINRGSVEIINNKDPRPISFKINPEVTTKSYDTYGIDYQVSNHPTSLPSAPASGGGSFVMSVSSNDVIFINTKLEQVVRGDSRNFKYPLKDIKWSWGEVIPMGLKK
jgi:hypothetical protein